MDVVACYEPDRGEGGEGGRSVLSSIPPGVGTMWHGRHVFVADLLGMVQSEKLGSHPWSCHFRSWRCRNTTSNQPWIRPLSWLKFEENLGDDRSVPSTSRRYCGERLRGQQRALYFHVSLLCLELGTMAVPLIFQGCQSRSRLQVMDTALGSGR